MRWLTRKLEGRSRASRLLVRATRALARRCVARRSGIPQDEIHQVEHTTEPDRYPQLFAAARDHFARAGRAPRAILSYGCSTGEECVTLRGYFPEARIVGADVNLDSLAIAEGRREDARTRYIRSTPDALRAEGPYDAIFALSVLCRWPETHRLRDASAVYPFARFTRALDLLDSCLGPEGLLAILNSTYRLRDWQRGHTYRVVPTPALAKEASWMPKFEPTGARLRRPEAPTPEVLFVKQSGGR